MAENCEHCTPSKPDQLTRNRRAFAELEAENDRLRGEVERLQAQVAQAAPLSVRIWISTNSRLPELGQAVTAKTARVIYFDAIYDLNAEDEPDWFVGAEPIKAVVTHWAELPTPRKYDDWQGEA